MKRRKHNFGAGPGALPLEVLEKARDEIPLFGETGMSVMELSHRGGDYAAIHEKTTALLVELLGIPSSHQVIYLQGGASLQFAMVPMNFRKEGESADYVVTGTWCRTHWAQYRSHVWFDVTRATSAIIRGRDERGRVCTRSSGRSGCWSSQ